MAKPGSTRPAIFVVLAAALGLSMGLFQMEKYPPFSWIMRLQFALFGQAEMGLTMVLGALLILGVLLVPILLYRRIRHGSWTLRPAPAPSTPAPTPAPPAPASAAMSTGEPPLLPPAPAAPASPAAPATSTEMGRTYQSWSPWAHGFAWAALMGVIFLGMGLYGVYQGYANREKIACSAESLYAGASPASRWVSIRATPMPDMLIGTEENHATWLYIPLVPEGWQEGKGIALVMRLRDSDMRDATRRMQPGDFEGMLAGSSLPGFVEDEFRKGPVRLSSGYRVLNLGRSPEGDLRAARFFVPAGAVILLVAGGAWIRGWRRSRPALQGEVAGAGPAPLKVKRVLSGQDPRPQ